MNGIDPIDDEAVVAAVLRIRPDAQAIYRFGSTVTGYARPDSDVDIAVLAPTPLSGDERLRMMGKVADAAGRSADIMDLRHASTIAQLQVIGKGALLYEKDSRARHRFGMFAAREYQDLKLRRRLLEADLLAGGWPHA